MQKQLSSERPVSLYLLSLSLAPALVVGSWGHCPGSSIPHQTQKPHSHIRAQAAMVSLGTCSEDCSIREPRPPIPKGSEHPDVCLPANRAV